MPDPRAPVLTSVGYLMEAYVFGYEPTPTPPFRDMRDRGGENPLASRRFSLGFGLFVALVGADTG